MESLRGLVVTRWTKAPNIWHSCTIQNLSEGACPILKVKVRARSNINNIIIVLSYVSKYKLYFKMFSTAAGYIHTISTISESTDD